MLPRVSHAIIYFKKRKMQCPDCREHNGACSEQNELIPWEDDAVAAQEEAQRSRRSGAAIIWFIDGLVNKRT